MAIGPMWLAVNVAHAGASLSIPEYAIRYTLFKLILVRKL